MSDMTPQDLIEIKTVHRLITRPRGQITPEESALIDKWIQVDSMQMLLDEIARLQDLVADITSPFE